MYQPVWVDPKHTPFQRILFRNSEGHIPELQTVNFGVNWAPSLAIRVLQQLATDAKLSHPRASNVIRNLMYVDDVLSVADSVEDGKLIIPELQSALYSAVFSLKKWNLSSCSKRSSSDHRLPRNRHWKHSQNSRRTLESDVRWVFLRPTRFSPGPFPNCKAVWPRMARSICCVFQKDRKSVV